MSQQYDFVVSEELADAVIRLAKEAGEMILGDGDFKIEHKGTKENYVTSTDVKIQGFLRRELTALVPGSLFMGEEEDLPAGRDADATGNVPYWIVDPIDGTANYARHLPASVVSIALAVSGTVLIGVVRNPYLGETFSAVRGRGSFLNGIRIHVSQRARENCLVSLAWSTYNKKLAPYCFDVTQRLYSVCEDIRRIGTAAYELCLVAKGAEDMLFEIRLSPWDYAAASLVVKEAGGFCSSLDTDVDLLAPCTVIAANTADNLAFLRDTVLDVIGDFRVEKD